jgi:hypothetical protein
VVQQVVRCVLLDARASLIVAPSTFTHELQDTPITTVNWFSFLHRDVRVPRLNASAIVGVCISCLIILAACSSRERTNMEMTGRLDSNALASFGRETDAALFQVAGAVLWNDTVVVAERSSSTLKFYSRDGDLLQTVGGKGQGPGEFSGIAWIMRSRGLLVVYDYGNRRLSEFSSKGVFIRAIEYKSHDTYGRVTPVGVFSDGSIVMWAITAPSAATDRSASEPVQRQPAVLLRYNSNGEFVDSLTSYLDNQMFVQPFGRGGQLRSELVFGRQGGVAVGGMKVVTADNNDYTVNVLDASVGTVRQLTPISPPEPEAVQKSDMAAARTHFVKDERPELRLGPVFDKMPVPSQFPPYGWWGRPMAFLHIGTTGDVWALKYGGIRSMKPAWFVFDSLARPKGLVSAPDEVALLFATPSEVLLLVRDADELERVELRRILW